MNRRSLLQTLTAGAALATLPALSQAQQKGKDYVDITPPQPGGTGGNVEVLEFFSFMCPHCHEFEPRLQPWVKKLPPYVSFKRVPVGFGRPDWTALARMYLTLNVMGLNEKLDAKVFEAIHTQRVALHDEKTRNEWLAKQGVDVPKFNDTWRSFGVESQFKRSEQLARDYKVPGVPALAINGRWMVNAGENVFKVSDQLIAQARGSK
ncbi:thiol:disulfide interchange protein DsbA/DsbL [Uliginosibacterium sp. H1]|uniref:thiol:disulfide interchange protein DsbA/DsbL n=1 Tax=Uliginosibacterium sp. H1 TaxID=3114757 RepID=UPI002E17B74B|nr:thiol:disulfide interchange protein DsbA/DsbL [Uliginosibacterium sp. H1]